MSKRVNHPTLKLREACGKTLEGIKAILGEVDLDEKLREEGDKILEEFNDIFDKVDEEKRELTEDDLKRVSGLLEIVTQYLKLLAATMERKSGKQPQ